VSRRAKAWTTAPTERLIELRADGISNAEIAAILKRPLEQVEREISKLIHAGTIASRHGLLWSHPDSYVQGRERTRLDVAADVGRLYMNGKSYKQIAAALTLTEAQVHNILSELFAEGMPKRNKRHALTDRQARAVHAAYLKGGGSIDKLAAEIGFSGAAVRKRMHKLELPIATRRDMAAEPDQSPDAA
jgi:DNA-binding CsgD family transcriptional regulator